MTLLNNQDQEARHPPSSSLGSNESTIILSCRVLLLTCLLGILGSPTVLGTKRVWSVVTHFGNDFILPDGCPVEECQTGDRQCGNRVRRITTSYEQCIS